MGRELQLPGIVGDLCLALGGRSKAAKILKKNTSTLYRWGHNLTRLGSSDEFMLQHFCTERGIKPQLYCDPGDRTYFVASTTAGWIIFPTVVGGWEHRTPWDGDPCSLEECDPARGVKAGFPT